MAWKFSEDELKTIEATEDLYDRNFSLSMGIIFIDQLYFKQITGREDWDKLLPLFEMRAFA